MLVQLVLLGVLLFLLRQALKKPSRYPPGRWGLPLVGYVPLPGPTFEDHLRHLHKKHGDIYMWRMGTQMMVFVHDYRIIRDAFNRPEFTDRPDLDMFSFKDGGRAGVIATNGVHWLNNRRFSLRQLRDLGMGKSKLVEAIQRQATFVAEIFRKQAGKEAPVPYALRLGIVNIIWQLVGGIQFDLDDPRMMKFEELIQEIVRTTTGTAIHDFLPWLAYVLPPFLHEQLTRRKDFIRITDKFTAYFDDVIAEHEATLNPGEPRDLIDGYLMEMEQRKDSPDSTFSKSDLAFLVLDLFFAGNETVTTTLTWAFYYLAAYPRVQKQLQAEIDAVLHDGRHATLEDKPRMPYTEAVIHEAMRKSSVAPLSVAHVASQDTTLGGYFIPKVDVLGAEKEDLASSGSEGDEEQWMDVASGPENGSNSSPSATSEESEDLEGGECRKATEVMARRNPTTTSCASSRSGRWTTNPRRSYARTTTTRSVDEVTTVRKREFNTIESFGISFCVTAFILCIVLFACIVHMTRQPPTAEMQA